MQRRGFWERAFDNEYQQRDDINEAFDHVDVLRDQVAKIDHNDRKLRQIVFELGAMVDVLVEMLHERGAVDPGELGRRVAQRLRPPAPPSSAAAGSSPYRDATGGEPEPAIPTAPIPLVTCARCETEVKRTSTQITEAGVICDRCFAQQSK